MPNKKESEAILNRLRAFFNAICEEAQRSPEFLDRLSSVILSEKSALSSGKPARKSSREPIIHIVEIVHSSGELGLRDKLQLLTNDQLARLAADEGVKRLKEAKSIDRENLISLLVETGSNRLKQGETFTKKG
ncbi:MAG: hypothetical protein Q7W05_13690 [Deltaproteobacteria bacterium]|jgi:hypothetical protein|nr:hypothetical protein [Deltaproteobacteria bacterium]